MSADPLATDVGERPPPVVDDDDDDDLFAPAATSPTMIKPVVNNDLLNMDTTDDLFTSASDEINLDDDPEPVAVAVTDASPRLSLHTEPIVEPIAPSPSPPPPATTVERLPSPVAVVPVVVPTPTAAARRSPTPEQEPVTNVVPLKEPEPVEQLKSLDYTMTVPKYEKVGEGMKAYVKYQVVFQPRGIAAYKDSRYEVWRRFSDFLGLHARLEARHSIYGRLIPEPPPKDMTVMMKTRMGKDDDEDKEYQLHCRRRELEMFINQVAKNPTYCVGLEFREFVTEQCELTHASETATLSVKTLSKTVSRFTDKLSKMTAPINETDPYFVSIAGWASLMHRDLDKLALTVDCTVARRREYIRRLNDLQHSIGLLASAEESTSLSRALSALSKTHEDISLAYDCQGNADLLVMSEFAHTHARMLQSVKNALMQRTKIWQKWQDALSTLNSKTSKASQLKLTGQSSKVPMAEREVADATTNADECKKAFDTMSTTMKGEIEFYDKDRVKHFKTTLLQYMKALAKSENEVMSAWERFKPEAEAIESSTASITA